MAIFTVHAPDISDEVARADRMVFVPDGFNNWALVFGLAFLLWKRAWMAAAVWTVVTVGLGVVCIALHMPPPTSLLLGTLMHLFLGLEANDLRRWALERRGLRCVDLVSGGSIDEAELVFFHRQPAPSRAASRPPTTGSRPPSPLTGPAVIGMFPDGIAS